jgi:hypothetical protein
MLAYQTLMRGLRPALHMAIARTCLRHPSCGTFSSAGLAVHVLDVVPLLDGPRLQAVCMLRRAGWESQALNRSTRLLGSSTEFVGELVESLGCGLRSQWHKTPASLPAPLSMC